MLPVTHKAMGYDATDADGKLTIHRVEIFCACERGGVQFDDVWIKTAVANAMEQQRGGYLPPLHVRHHEPSTDATNAVRAAGFFKITGAEPMTFKGARRTAVMADLIITDPHICDEIKAARLPYRSVEIFDVDKPAIDGLALLDHEAPFLELPMLMLAQMDEESVHDQPTSSTVIPGQPPGGAVRMANATIPSAWRSERVLDDGPMIGCYRRGPHADLLFKQETEMATPENKIVPEEKPAQQNFADDEKDKKEKDEDKSENMEGDEEGGLDVSAVVKAISSGSISIADMDSILEAIQAQGGAVEEEEPAEEIPAQAAAPGGEAMKKGTGANSVQMAAMQGRLDAMEAKDKDRDATETRTADVALAMKRLAGRALGSDPEAKLVKYHQDFGPEAFKAYVDSFAETFGVLPTEGQPTTFTANDPKAPECVLKFYKDGPDQGEKAARLASTWEQLNGSGMRVPLDRFVENGMNRAQA